MKRHYFYITFLNILFLSASFAQENSVGEGISDIVTLSSLISSIEIDKDQEKTIPLEYRLYQNYPNPFNPSTTISYELPEASNVRLSIYNILGKKISVLVNKLQQVGYHKTKFDAQNIPSGIYCYQLLTDKFISSKKMLIVK